MATAGTSSDVDLSTLHVELGGATVAGGVESDELSTEKVLAVGNAGWDLDVLVSIGGNQIINSPLASGGVVSGLRDLEPSISNTAVSECVVDLLQVGHDGTLVAGIDDIYKFVTKILREIHCWAYCCQCVST